MQNEQQTDTIENTPAELQVASDLPPADAERQETPQEAQETPQEAPQADAETFPRAYVEKLRQEAADARVRAKRADDLARELFTARVAATGRLADPNDLPFDDALLADMPALEAAIDELVAQHPHYAARRPRGDIGQGATGSDGGTVDLAGLLRARA